MKTAPSMQACRTALLGLGLAALPALAALAADSGYHRLANISELPRDCAAPQWPAEALVQHHYGMVSMKLLVEADGRVGKLEALQSSGHPQLDKLTHDAIAKCVFAPAIVDGKPAPAWTRLDYVWAAVEKPFVMFDAGEVRKAARSYQRRAREGDREAQYMLGEIYRSGNGLRVDFSAAAAWYRKAAEQGHVAAQYNLAMMHSLGVGVPRSVDDAAKWMGKAAMQGHADAQDLYGVMVEQGKGVPRSEAGALEWFRKAALQGNPHGQYNLAQCYEFGIGQPRDMAAAGKWYAQALQQGVGEDRVSMMVAGTLPKTQRGIGPGTVVNPTPSLEWQRYVPKVLD